MAFPPQNERASSQTLRFSQNSNEVSASDRLSFGKQHLEQTVECVFDTNTLPPSEMIEQDFGCRVAGVQALQLFRIQSYKVFHIYSMLLVEGGGVQAVVDARRSRSRPRWLRPSGQWTGGSSLSRRRPLF